MNRVGTPLRAAHMAGPAARRPGHGTRATDTVQLYAARRTPLPAGSIAHAQN